jgi:signal recognition particle receptor subunit beta
VRVVYDGPGMAGKTTNLKQICQIVPERERTEMVTPAELKGRTMFFDWMEISGPRELGFSLKFQLITVPGQAQRNYRRKPLVEMADVVVFVCDSTPQNLPDSLRVFARLRALMRRRPTPLPLVVQANKQDLDGALSPARVRKRLRLNGKVPIVAAAANARRGVSETLSTALKLGIEAIDDDAVEPLLQAFQNADNLFDHVLAFEDSPREDEPIDVEELNVNADEADVEAADAHLAAAPLDALEARARRAAQARRAGAERAPAAAPKSKRRGGAA